MLLKSVCHSSPAVQDYYLSGHSQRILKLPITRTFDKNCSLKCALYRVRYILTVILNVKLRSKQQTTDIFEISGSKTLIIRNLFLILRDLSFLRVF